MKETKMNEHGHYARLRKRFLDGGLEGFLDYEVIELLLKLADNRRDQKNTAKNLIKKFKSLKGVLEAHPDELKKEYGVGPANVFGIKMIQAVSRRYLKDQIINTDYVKSSNDVIDYLKHRLRDKNRESFLLVLLNGQNRIISVEKLFTGTITTSAVYPREVIKFILQKDAAAVIFVHNHPSGNPQPSRDDQSITNKLISACKSIDVVVHDHIIIAGNQITSFADKGLMPD
ncbi:MAG: DNA repair protein RadC [Candidatus Marinimicrobia bacterium]|jgi:DNA repair protein RadC|nr:DNA repair protein RadC [Candidatus Neomarinimicrobiota bacterium]MBT3633259.1 DNA repair protein RadC [Candidatus Neomarinimicrobiota bacterium]MBT3682140.1 DNA repair protein RadC [Candidatus Neomarinimicrobiota bacterium]MBT3758859.1 DNA repair protein RadC [Candidatus Neomarinimicrobiota bacterium]MBT3895266.1 DNA repair protein RadC [Candidatus Neomarinimicrobiota bacterium]